MTNYVLICYAVALLIVLSFMVIFEIKKPTPNRIMPIVIMVAAATVGRAIFSFVPQIQPVTAIVIIMGICYGREMGFITGALCALVSNMILGQGPWTLFQMLGWGTIGFFAGFINEFDFNINRLKEKRIVWSKNIHMIIVCAYGFFSAMLFSVITDIWTISTLDTSMRVGGLITILATGMLFNIGHGIGNIVFLILLYPSTSKKLLRMKRKTIPRRVM